MKRKQREKTPDHEVIDVDDIEVNSSQPLSGASNKRSWVWNHFKEKPGTNKAICQVITKSGGICGRSIKKDKSSSTKSFHTHLETFHRLSDPSLTKKTKTKHMDISKWRKSGTVQPQVKYLFFI
jgi:hypothetical protein